VCRVVHEELFVGSSGDRCAPEGYTQIASEICSCGKFDAGREMSENLERRGTASTHRTVLEVATNSDGSMKIIFNEKVVGSRIPGEMVDDELCAKWGFCGEELAQSSVNLASCGRVGCDSVIKRGVSRFHVGNCAKS